MTASSSKQRISNEVLSWAWIGDAVLSLWARLKILKEDGQLDGRKMYPDDVQSIPVDDKGAVGIGSRNRQSLSAFWAGGGPLPSLSARYCPRSNGRKRTAGREIQ
jgi:hypothetical protein